MTSNIDPGITYFLMPMIYDSLKADMGLSSKKAWRVAFIVPYILITATFIGMIFFCQDTPTGKWSERHNATKHLLEAHGVQPSVLVDRSRAVDASSSSSGTATPHNVDEKTRDTTAKASPTDVEAGSFRKGSISGSARREATMTEEEMIATAKGEIVVAPTFKEACNVFFSLQTAFHACTYICSFGKSDQCPWTVANRRSYTPTHLNCARSFMVRSSIRDPFINMIPQAASSPSIAT